MLGVTFNMGVFMGYAAINNSLNLQILGPLYLGAILWTVVYDTIYAFQDIRYDKQVGIHSSAIQFEKNPKTILATLAALSVGSIGLTAYLSALHPSFYMFLGAASLHYAWQIGTLDILDKDRCKRMFISNQYFGLLLLVGFICGRYFQKTKDNKISI